MRVGPTGPALTRYSGAVPTPRTTQRGRRTRSLGLVVMAAGKGKRIRSALPKVLHEICGRPVLWHVLKAAEALKPDRLVVVVAHEPDQVREAVSSWGIRPEPSFVDQGEPLGTAHAVMVTEEAVGPVEHVVVLPGDEPLVTGQQLRDLLRIQRHRDVAGVVQITVPEDARGFARVIRDEGGRFIRLAEGTVATREELALTEVATSIYSFRRGLLFDALPAVDADNSQGEHYLPDVLGILVDKGERIEVQLVDNGGSTGANSRSELARAAAVMRGRINEGHMVAGVTIVDPATTYVDAEVRIGRDTVILPNTYLEGGTRIGEGCRIGPSTRISGSTVGDRSTVEFSVVVDAALGRDVTVGPYAHLRPGARFEDGSKAGSFVEVKKSRVGRGSKVPHLAYVGDATLGRDVNIGAGTITANYDGWDKHETVIEDGVKVGSDTMLVAPVRMGKGSMTGAGSVITRDVPPGALAIERSDQRTVPGYRKRKEQEKAARRRRHEGGGD